MCLTANMIRKNIVPLFKEINSNAVKNVGRFADNMVQDADYLKLETNKALEIARIEKGLLVEEIKELHPAILSRVIMSYIQEQTAFATDSLHITHVIESVKTNGFAVSLQGGYEAVVKNGILKVLKPHKKREEPLEFPVVELPFEAFEYSPELTEGVLIAEALHEDNDLVFKTLVTESDKKEHFVFVIPVAETLDLKAAAKAVGVKSVSMLKQKELLPLTGYIHGGCSPVGMKKPFKTVIRVYGYIVK